jgi:UPF0755 protein
MLGMPDHFPAGDHVWKQESRPPNSRNRITLWVVLSLLGLMLLAAGSGALFVWNGLSPAAPGDTVQLEIPRGSSPFKVAELLEDKGIIRNAFLFKYYLRYNNEGHNFQAGVYEMHPGMRVDAIITQLNMGQTIKAEMVRFTIPEGYTILQIADKLSSEGIIDKEKFLSIADSPAASEQNDTVKEIPASAKLHHRLEGYLFPETYELEKGSTEADIVARMIQELDKKLGQLPEGWESQLDTLGLSFHEMMTVASLVEREVRVPDERKLVSGIIDNRLKKKMPLQIDATVQYLLDKPKERLLYEDTKVDDPYNTYKIPGLPPGPIASPSLASIEAALYPEASDYFYYVTKKDGTGGHLFARTYAEHQKNIAASNKIAKGGMENGG